jgi:hypothetical protein
LSEEVDRLTVWIVPAFHISFTPFVWLVGIGPSPIAKAQIVPDGSAPTALAARLSLRPSQAAIMFGFPPPKAGIVIFGYVSAAEGDPVADFRK